MMPEIVILQGTYKLLGTYLISQSFVLPLTHYTFSSP